MANVQVRSKAFIKKVNLKTQKSGEEAIPVAEVTLEISLQNRETLGTDLAVLLSKVADISLEYQDPQISVFDDVE